MKDGVSCFKTFVIGRRSCVQLDASKERAPQDPIQSNAPKWLMLRKRKHSKVFEDGCSRQACGAWGSSGSFWHQSRQTLKLNPLVFKTVRQNPAFSLVGQQGTLGCAIRTSAQCTSNSEQVLLILSLFLLLTPPPRQPWRLLGIVVWWRLGRGCCS